jgi:hypothetical protein
MSEPCTSSRTWPRFHPLLSAGISIVQDETPAHRSITLPLVVSERLILFGIFEHSFNGLSVVFDRCIGILWNVNRSLGIRLCSQGVYSEGFHAVGIRTQDNAGSIESRAHWILRKRRRVHRSHCACSTSRRRALETAPLYRYSALLVLERD